jgi:4-diphosphocytidyl-2-C-methyl-D-erythritol kinase
MEDCPLVVAKMGAGISTVWAYGELDRIHNHFKEERKGSDAAILLAKHLSGGDFSAAGKLCYNIFEEVVPSVQPCVEPLKETMKENGAIRAMMSGSGPAVFGKFSDSNCADRACITLSENGFTAFKCCSVYPEDTL